MHIFPYGFWISRLICEGTLPTLEDKLKHRTLDFSYIGMIQFGSGVKILSKNI